MKIATKLLVLCLVVLMCFGSLVACGGGDETTTTTTTTPAGPEGPTGPQIDWKKFDGKTCVFFYKGDYGPTSLYIKAENVGTNQTDRAVLNRINLFKDKTGITIDGIRGAQGNFNTLKPILDAGDPENVPDVLFLAGGDVGSLMAQNDLVCLNDPATPNMDFTANCWHENINKALAVWDHYYAVSGYYDTSNFERGVAMFFDRDALDTINPATIDLQTYPELAGFTGEDSLYEWATDGVWTWDKAVALAKLFAGVDGTYNGVNPTKNGIQWQSTAPINILASVNLQPFKNDESGVPTLNLDAEAQEKLNYLHANLLYDGGSKYANWVGSIWNNSPEEAHPNLFGTNHTALFHVDKVEKLKAYAGYSTEAVPFRYGILPLPKYNEQQENYYCMSTEWNTTLACIAKDCESVDFSTFVLQHFTEMGRNRAQDNVKTIFEAVIEDGLSGRYAGTTDNAEQDKAMLQIVMDSVDAWMWEYFGGLFPGAEGVGILGQNICQQASPNYQSFMDTNAPKITQGMYQLLIDLGWAQAAS